MSLLTRRRWGGESGGTVGQQEVVVGSKLDPSYVLTLYTIILLDVSFLVIKDSYTISLV